VLIETPSPALIDSVANAVAAGVVIPAYRPNRTVIEVVRGIAKRGVSPIVVVDDGSGPDYRAIFDELARIEGVEVLRNAINLGKGAALKAGMNYLLSERPDLSGVVTADADGQHDPEDVVRVLQRFLETPEALVLGARSFSGKVPLRSRFGNLLTRFMMRLVLGRNLTDTQTGLRAVPRALMEKMLRVPAFGYEFELEMLIAAKHTGMPVMEEPIRTIYEPGNPTSHFQPLRDSMKIYFVLLRFSLISLMTAAVDNVTFYLVFHATGTIAGAQAAARTAAILFNYRAVRHAVFFSQEKHSIVLPRYLALAAANALASYAGMRLITLHLPVGVMTAKIAMESLLFVVSFLVQRDFIFTRRGGKTK
jgi:glycosyltransferase involved in cell wall biosynthesis